MIDTAFAQAIVNLLAPVLADTLAPFRERVVLSLIDSTPAWIGVGLTFATFLVAHAARKEAREAKETTKIVGAEVVKVQENVALIERNTNSMTKTIAQLAEEKGIGIGELKEEKRGVDAAAQLEKGRKEGIAEERARDTTTSTATASVSKTPLPVADDRTAVAAERSADAQERTATAAEESKK